MSYTNNWYEQYKLQLQEPGVRRAHDKMFRLFEKIMNTCCPSVIDLGCATMEFYRYGNFLGNYFGIDKNYVDFEMEDDGDGGKYRVACLGDYLHENFPYQSYFVPDTFVSLFSTEIIMPAEAKYNFYEKIFRENPNIQYGLVAGFYYPDSENSEYIFETNGDFDNYVYQTIEKQQDFISSYFDELRIYQNVKSEMFGSLVECWKVFMRRVETNDN